MTKEAFRNTETHRQRMVEILNDEVFQEALMTLRDSQVSQDVSEDAPEVASVRQLSKQAGYQQALTELVSLSLPLPQYQKLGEPTWEPETEESQSSPQ